jgi:hypothetical protein
MLGELRELEEKQLADTLRLYPKAPPPDRGKPMRRAGKLWQWDWEVLEYVASDDANQSSRAERPVEPFVEAHIRGLVVEMAATIERLLIDTEMAERDSASS